MADNPRYFEVRYAPGNEWGAWHGGCIRWSVGDWCADDPVYLASAYDTFLEDSFLFNAMRRVSEVTTRRDGDDWVSSALVVREGDKWPRT
jgi:hypothetical protein